MLIVLLTMGWLRCHGGHGVEKGGKSCFGESEDGVCSAGRLVGYVIGPGLRWQLLGGRGGGRELAVLSCRMGDGGDGR